jgi:hypothetical protein
LKPFSLAGTHTPPEMRDWVVRFRSYASTSNIKLVSLDDQRAILRNCLAPELAINMEGVLATAGTTVDVCIAAIETHFLSLKPLFTRRWECFKIKKNRRPFKDYVADLRRNVAEADFKAMTDEQLMVFMLLLGCQTETAMFVELRKLPDPSIAELMNKAETLEQALGDASVTTAVVAAVAVVAGPVARPVVETPAEIIAAVAAACGGCGRAHDRSLCPFRKSECFRCGKVGHIRERCSSASRGESHRRRRGRQAGTVAGRPAGLLVVDARGAGRLVAATITTRAGARLRRESAPSSPGRRRAWWSCRALRPAASSCCGCCRTRERPGRSWGGFRPERCCGPLQHG